MRRLNVFLAMVVFAGSLVVFTGAPHPVYASDGQVCCDGADNTRCCGDECKADEDGCSACSGFWGCLLF